MHSRIASLICNFYLSAKTCWHQSQCTAGSPVWSAPPISLPGLVDLDSADSEIASLTCNPYLNTRTCWPRVNGTANLICNSHLSTRICWPGVSIQWDSTSDRQILSQCGRSVSEMHFAGLWDVKQARNKPTFPVTGYTFIVLVGHAPCRLMRPKSCLSSPCLW